MLLLTFSGICFTEPIFWKAIRISHSEPCHFKLNLCTHKKYFIVWKASIKVEFAIDFKSSDAWITLLPSQPSVVVILSRHCRNGSYILWKSSSTMLLSTHRVSQNILNLFLVIFLILRKSYIMLHNLQISNIVLVNIWKIFQVVSANLTWCEFLTLSNIYEMRNWDHDWHSSYKLRGELSLAEELCILYFFQTGPLSEICNLWCWKAIF